MIIVNSISDKYFSVNGVNFAKIYQPLKQGSDSLGIYNVYNSGQQVVSSTVYSSFIVDGVVYDSVEETIAALLLVVYSSAISSLVVSLDNKTDKGGYYGTAQDLKNEIDSKIFEGVKTYQGYAALLAVDPIPSDGTSAKVENDANTSLNGGYSVVSGSWVKSQVYVEDSIRKENVSIGVDGRSVFYERSRNIFIKGASEYDTIFRDGVTRGEVLEVINSLKLIGVSEEGEVRLSFFANYASGTLQLKFSQKQDNGSWIYLFDEPALGTTVNPNGTTLYDVVDPVTKVRCIAELDLRNIANVAWHFQGNTEVNSYFIVKKEFLLKYSESPSYEEIGVFLRNSDVNIYTNDFFFQGQRVIKDLQLIGADTSLKYSARFLARNHSSFNYRFIITYDPLNDGNFVDYADFDLIDSVSSETGYSTIIDKTIVLKNGWQKIRLKAIIDYTKVPDGTTQTLFSNGSFILNPNNVKKIVSENVGTVSLVDNYPLVSQSLAVIKDKIKNNTENVYFKFDGDSMIANESGEKFENPELLPAQMGSKNYSNLLYSYGLNTIVEAKRFDVAGFFTETGSGWSNDAEFFTKGIGILNAWERMSNEDICAARYTDDVNASFSFDWNLDENKFCDLNYPKHFLFDSNITVSISASNKVEVEQDSGNVEANGFVFSQNIIRKSQGTGFANQMSNVILPLRKKTGASGVVTVTISKGNTSEYIGYSNVEFYDNFRLICKNIAKGGDEIERSADKYRNNIFERKTDVLIHSLNLNNDITFNAVNTAGVLNHQSILNSYQDYFFGDRVGFENVNSIKNLSNDFNDMKLIIILPSPRKDYVDGNSAKRKSLDGGSAEMDVDVRVLWLKAKQLFESNGVAVIDLWDLMKSFAISKGITIEDSLSSLGMADADAWAGDDVHYSNIAHKIVLSKIYNSFF